MKDSNIGIDDLLHSIGQTLLDALGQEWALVPGNNGQDCPGNGFHKDAHGNPIDVQCDECDYLICCLDNDMCIKCFEENGKCPENFINNPPAPTSWDD